MEKVWEEILQGVKKEYPNKTITLSEEKVDELRKITYREFDYQNGIAKCHVSNDCLPTKDDIDTISIVEGLIQAVVDTIKLEIKKKLSKLN
jgi:hypothetical protein